MPIDPKQDAKFEELARTLVNRKRKPASRRVRSAFADLFDADKYLFEEEVEEEFEDEIFLRDFMGPGLTADLPAFSLEFRDLGAGAVDTTAYVYGGRLGGTFTRATTATTVDRNGLIVSVASGVARSYYDPETLEYLGYLAEGARTNICLRSEVLGTTWSPTRATVATNQTTAPDGAVTADKIEEDATAGNSHVLSQSVTLSGSTAYTFSVFAKAAERSWVRLGWNDGAGNQAAWFNLATGAVGTQESGVVGAIKAYPNGWYRCAVTITSDAVPSTPIVFICPAPADNTSVYDGIEGDGIYAWGAQLEAASFASSYIPTTTAAVTRNADVLTYPDTFISNTQGTVYAQAGVFWTAAPSSYAGLFVIEDDAGRSLYRAATGSATQITIFDGTNQASKTCADYSTAQRKFSSSWGSDLAITEGGLTVQTATFDGQMGGGGSTNVGIGNNPGGSAAFFGHIRRVAYYNARLPNATLQQLTA